MQEFKENINHLINAFPDEASAFIAKDWKLLLLLPNLQRVVQQQLIKVFTTEIVAKLEQEQGLDFGYLMEEIYEIIHTQEAWLKSLGSSLESDFLLQKTKSRLVDLQKELSSQKMGLAKMKKAYKVLRDTVTELERESNTYKEQLQEKTRLQERKQELENLQKWIDEEELENLKKNVLTLEKELREVEKSRTEWEQRKEQLLGEKKAKTKDLQKLERTCKLLVGANSSLDEVNEIIEKHNNKISAEIRAEVESAMIHQEANRVIVTDLNLDGGLEKQLELLKMQLEEIDQRLAERIKQNTKDFVKQSLERHG